MTARWQSLPGGRGLALRFYHSAAKPIIEDSLAGAGYLAGRLGSGSDVLGFDTERSHDHDFGCRLTVLVDDDDADLLPGLTANLEAELPTGELGDEVGSTIIASRLCRDIMHLAFLIERTWMPYPKWQGLALNRLECGSKLKVALASVQQASGWQDRQQSLAAALETLAEQHDKAGLKLPDPVVQPFYDRPAIIANEAIPSFLLDQVRDPEVRAVSLMAGRW